MKQCLKCGASASDGSRFCPACGAEMGGDAGGTTSTATNREGQPAEGSASGGASGSASGGASPKGLQPVPPKYLPWSITLLVISVICLCSPISITLSIIALVFGTQIEDLVKRGKVDEAKGKSKSTLILLIISTGMAVLWTIGCFVFYALYGLTMMKG